MKKKRIHYCNLLEATPTGQRLWEFDVDGPDPKLENSLTVPAGAELPPKDVTKDWHDLFQPKLNLAWLTPENAFIRVIQLPKVDAPELLSMVEFQLEKLSPFPVAQIVWGAEFIESRAENSITAIVCIASRDVIEDYLTAVEKLNYRADKLEVPFLNQILAGGIKADGVYLYPEIGHTPGLWLVAWWSAGTLQHLQAILVPEATGTLEILREQVMQTAWAGEVEGWLQMPLCWHVVAEPEQAAPLQQAMIDWSDLPIEQVTPMSAEASANYSAARAAREEPGINLLPPEFAAKYRQHFVDRLWMRGIGAVIGLYIIGVVIYFAALSVLMFQQNRVETQVVSLSGSYTNVLKLKEQVNVMQEQMNLKYAALDSWKAVAELLPEDFTLTWMIFGKGKSMEVQLHGNGPQGKENELIEYNEKLRTFTIEGQQIFKNVTPPNSQARVGSPLMTWQFFCELNTSEGAE